MKLAISGKGGVGKTTVTALLAQAFAEDGKDVLVADADPSPCLAEALGFPAEKREKLHPISEMDELIFERTGANRGAVGGFFSLNPRVDDIPDRFAIEHKGVRLLEMGTVDMGGAGCICPESALLKTLFTHLLFRKDDILIMDMYAGVEHLGRATADFVDAMIIVIEPTFRSLKVAHQIHDMSQDIGLNQLWLIANKVDTSDDVAFVEENSTKIPLLGYFQHDPKVLEADRLGLSTYDHVESLRIQAKNIAGELRKLHPGKE